MSPPAAQGGGVLVVVPTKNSERTLARCLRSLRAQSVPCRLVVVDNFSDDATQDIARRLADRLIVAGPERSRQRNVGAGAEPAAVIGFVDSDMVVAGEVVAEADALLAGGAGAVIVPERTVGEGYWARVRALERSFYEGLDDVEAARFFRNDVLSAAGGFDEALDAGEDWDLTLRARRLAPVARTRARIDHDEGRVRYLDDCRKKAAYALGIRAFADKNGVGALGRAARRPYLRRPWQLASPHPLLGAGVVALKLGEACAVALALVRAPARNGGDPRPAGTAQPQQPSRSAAVAPTEPAAAPVSATLVVPAYNEEQRIERCLASVLREPLPAGFGWREVVVLAGASTDRTAELAGEFGARHGGPPVRVVTSPTRLGKGGDLGSFHAGLVAEGRLDEVVVAVDADAAVVPGGLARLLTPFSSEAELAVAWGSDEPDDRSVGRKASAYQMDVIEQLARLLGSGEPRAYGRFFAYRLGLLAGFCWQAERIVDDLQLASYARAAGLRTRSVLDARVSVTPARGYRDFYLQTYRSFEALDERSARDGNARVTAAGADDAGFTAAGADEAGLTAAGADEAGLTVIGVAPPPAGLRALAFALALRRRPFDGLCYLNARAVAAVVHLLRPRRFTRDWSAPTSTKGYPLVPT